MEQIRSSTPLALTSSYWVLKAIANGTEMISEALSGRVNESDGFYKLTSFKKVRSIFERSQLFVQLLNEVNYSFNY
jgi:hypothetical protein